MDACDKQWSFGGEHCFSLCHATEQHDIKREVFVHLLTPDFLYQKHTGVSKRNSSAQMLMTSSHLWCFPHNSWGRGPPCRWACHSSTQHPCAWWRGYSRPVERTALPLSSLHNHTEPPPTPRQSETPTKNEQNTQMFSAPAENLTITKLLYILLKTHRVKLHDQHCLDLLSCLCWLPEQVCQPQGVCWEKRQPSLCKCEQN